MYQVLLNGTPIRTSAIGFGCGSLTGAASREQSLKLLDAAYDSNVTHFDVAPYYGYGASEVLLGEFAKNKRQKITITTKYGIKVAKSMAQNQGLMNLARKISKALPFVKKLLRRSASSLVSIAPFTPADAQISLDQSLKNLQTDYLDALLLHEADLQTSTSPDLIAFLERQIKCGKIRTAGVGSEFSKLGSDAAAFPSVYSVLQFQSNLEAPNLRHLQNANARAIISHGSLRILPALYRSLAANSALKTKIQNLLQDDPQAALPSALLQIAAAENPAGLTLFATCNPAHIAKTLQHCPYSPDQLCSLAAAIIQILHPQTGAPT